MSSFLLVARATTPLEARRAFLGKSSLMLTGGAVALLAGQDALAAKKGGKSSDSDVRILNTALGAELEAIASATKLPIVLGGAPEEMNAPDYLGAQRVRIALQGHAPFAAATQAVYETLKALREGASPKSLKGLASSELTGRAMREAEMKKRSTEFLVLKK